MRHTLLLSTVAFGALAFVSHQAQSCDGTHLSTLTSGSGDANCIFNVDVSADAALTEADGTSGPYGTAVVLQEIESALSGQADGASINVTDNGGNPGVDEGSVSFTVPQGVGEVVITVSDTDGDSSTATLNLSNGSFTAGGGGGCTPPPPPSLPVNPMPPEAGQPVWDDAQGDLSDSLQGNCPAGDDWAPSGHHPQNAQVQ